MSRYGSVRERLVYRKGLGMVPFSDAGPREVDAPFIQTDSMAPLEHMATGRIHDSKSAFRRDTKESGCVEVGNDRNIKSRVDKISEDKLVRAFLEAEQIVSYERRQ